MARINLQVHITEQQPKLNSTGSRVVRRMKKIEPKTPLVSGDDSRYGFQPTRTCSPLSVVNNY